VELDFGPRRDRLVRLIKARAEDARRIADEPGRLAGEGRVKIAKYLAEAQGFKAELDTLKDDG
jgi:hypothetical protein